MSIGSEFKEFAVKGNVVDLAIGIVIGSAFGKIVSSLVADVIMPPIGLALGGANFTDFALKLGVDPKGAPILMKYGVFLQTVFDFLIITIVIFMLIKGINKMKKPPVPAATPVPVPPPRQEVLLEQILDTLKKR